jgi:hypothetical protein
MVNASVKTIDYLEIISFDNDSEYGFWYVIITRQYLKPVLFLILPVLSLIKNNRYTWVIIQSYFYFLLSNFIFQNVIYFNVDVFEYIPLVLIFFTVILPLFLMNLKKVHSKAYQIKIGDLLLLNIIAATLGMLMSLILLWVKY